MWEPPSRYRLWGDKHSRLVLMVKAHVRPVEKASTYPTVTALTGRAELPNPELQKTRLAKGPS